MIRHWPGIKHSYATVVILVLLLAAVLLSGYAGRRQIVENGRAGCQRGIADRASNAAAWYAAYQARAAAAQEEAPGSSLQHINEQAARLFYDAAWSLNSRVTPERSLTVNGEHPLSLGRLDCAKAYPAAAPVQL